MRLDGENKILPNPFSFPDPEHRPRAHAKYMLAVPDHIMITESVTVNVAKNTVFSRFPFCCNRHGKAVWTLSITGKAAYLVYLILSSKFSPTMCLLEDWCNICGCQQLLKDLGKIQRFRFCTPSTSHLQDPTSASTMPVRSAPQAAWKLKVSVNANNPVLELICGIFNPKN